jgi:succinyl-diaminopimelate desuccinylase
VRFDTVNPPGNEEPAIRRLGEFLEQAGIVVEYQRLSENRLNLVARIRGSRSGHLVLCGHIDVVHPGAGSWEVEPFGGVITDGRLIGRGSADMKGGVAAMAQAMADLAGEHFQPKADLILAVTAGEEVDMAGAKLLSSTDLLSGASRIVIGEPTSLDVFRAEKGVFWTRVTAHGRTAHGSMPNLGVNAISFMARLIIRLEEYPFAFEPSDVLGNPTISVNVIDGGVKTNVVPDRCRAEIDMRLVPGQSRADVLGRLKALMEEIRAEIPVRTEVDILQDVPAVETPADDELVQATASIVNEVSGKKPTIGGVSYGTDGAIIAPSLGASMVIVGPGAPEQAHQPNEYVKIEELESAVEIYKGLARRLL